MKRIVFFCFLLFSYAALAQSGQANPSQNARTPEPDLETSYDSEELLIIALIGLALLMVLYFFFRRTRKH